MPGSALRQHPVDEPNVLILTLSSWVYVFSFHSSVLPFSNIEMTLILEEEEHWLSFPDPLINLLILLLFGE